MACTISSAPERSASLTESMSPMMMSGSRAPALMHRSTVDADEHRTPLTDVAISYPHAEVFLEVDAPDDGEVWRPLKSMPVGGRSGLWWR
jgi:hypothetical protein